MEIRRDSSKRIAGVYGGPDKPQVVLAQLEVSSDLCELERVREFVRHVCRELTGPALDDKSTCEFELAATEAASNIMKHSYHGRDNQTIDVLGEVSNERVRIQLCHDGESFIHPVVEEPVLDVSVRGGLGLFIMQQTIDEIVHGTKDDRQSMTLIKNRQSTVNGVIN